MIPAIAPVTNFKCNGIFISSDCDGIFDELDLHRLEAACLPVNKRSLRTLKNNGFAIEGLVRKYLKINGNWEDHLLLSCIKDESL